MVIGERGLKEGKIEIKWRNQSEPRNIPAATAAAAEAILAEIDGARRQEIASCEERRLARSAARPS